MPALSTAAALCADAAAMAAGAWLLWNVTEPPAVDPDSAQARAGPWRRCAVVIPARDEAGSLPRLLASLAAQSRAPDELIVVDDHSADGTGELAAAAGARVLLAPGPPPAGWLGKPWACHAGVSATPAEVLVLLDADVVLAPDALERLLAAHASSGGGLLSVAPSHRTKLLHEQLSAVCSVVAMMGTGAFSARRCSQVAMAFGPCIVVSRDAYERAGGHCHPDVRGQVAEDVAMARRFCDTGSPVTLLGGGDLVAYRMYPDGVRQLADGWTKMLAGGAARSPRVPAALTALWVTGALRGARCGWTALRPGPGRARAAAVYAGWAVEMRWLMRRAGRWQRLTPWAFPAPLTAFVALTLRSAIRAAAGRPTVWRGRRVPTS